MVSQQALNEFLGANFPNRVAVNMIYDRDEDGVENLAGLRVVETDGVAKTVVFGEDAILTESGGYIMATGRGVVTIPGTSKPVVLAANLDLARAA
jgi:hypothetical protein